MNDIDRVVNTVPNAMYKIFHLEQVLYRLLEILEEEGIDVSAERFDEERIREKTQLATLKAFHYLDLKFNEKS